MKMTNRKSFTAEDAEDAEEGQNQNKGTYDNPPEAEPARVLCARRGRTSLLIFLRVLLKGYSTLREGICVLGGECLFGFTRYPSASMHRIV